MKAKKNIVVATLALAVLFAVYNLLKSDEGQLSQGSAESSQSENSDEKRQVQRAPVIVALIKVQRSAPPIRFTQVCRGIHEAKIDAKRPGRIVSIPAVLGQAVSAGETLLRLDSDLEKYQLSAAEAARRAAESAQEKARMDWERAEELRKDKLISESALERSRLSFEIAQSKKQTALANEQIARKNLSETNIKAAISGEISRLPFEIGETPPPGATVVEITDRTSLIMDIFLAERNLNSVSIGDSAVVTGVSLRGVSFAGVVRAISPKGDERTKLFRAELVVENPGLLLRSGQTLTASFSRRVESGKIVIPSEAALSRDGRPHVALVLNQRASFQPITLGERIGSGVTVLSGLKAGDRIVVEGALALFDGAPLNVIREISLDSLLN